jgi:hypothetical protein
MNDIPYNKKMGPKTKAIAILLVLLIIGLVIGFAIARISLNYAERKLNEKTGGGPQFQRFIQAFGDMYTLGTIFICINILLLLGLLYVYLDAFRKTSSSFMFGLLLFIGVLFVQSILSLPVLQAALGNTGYALSNTKLLEVLPNMFETLALIILFYLSME